MTRSLWQTKNPRIKHKKLTRAQKLRAYRLARKHGRGETPDDVVTFYAELLLGGVPSPRWRERISMALEKKLTPESGRRVVILALSSPEAQLA